MKLHGFKTVPIGKIKAPGNIEALKRDPLTLEIAESFDATGGQPVSPIVIEFGTWQLRGGRHRFAAALLRKLKEVDARMVEGTPEELETMELIEQLKRRKSTDAEIARLLDLQHPLPDATFPEVEDEPPLAPKLGRPSEGKAARVSAVAKLTGRTPLAVVSAEQRAKRAAEPKPEDNDHPTSCINTMCLKIPDEVHADAYAEWSFLQDIVRELVTLQGDCTRHGVFYQHVKEALHDAAAAARAQMPTSVCPHCKLTKQQNRCQACKGRGWLNAQDMQSIPTKLMARGSDAGVFVDGTFTLLKEIES